MEATRSSPDGNGGTQHENYEEMMAKQGENASTTERVNVHRAAPELKSAICHRESAGDCGARGTPQFPSQHLIGGKNADTTALRDVFQTSFRSENGFRGILNWTSS
jgi:hypothetical protein